MSEGLDNQLPVRGAVGALYPLTVTRVAVSGLATIANGGTQQNLPAPNGESIGALMLLGVNSGVVFGTTGGSGDQYIPVFHGSIFPLDGLTYFLATQAATADGTVFVLGFRCIEDALAWKELLGKVPPQQGAFAPVTVDTELPAASAIPAPGSGNEASATVTSRIGSILIAGNAANLAQQVAVQAVSVASGALKVSLFSTGNGDLGLISQADGLSNAQLQVPTAALGRAYNGSTWDRMTTTDAGETAGDGALLPAYRENFTGGPGKATDATGTILSYTVPTGKSALITSISWQLNSAQALTTMAVDVNEASPSQTVRIFTGAAGTSFVQQLNLTLNAGDAILIKVAVASGAGGSTADCSINAQELR